MRSLAMLSAFALITTSVLGQVTVELYFQNSCDNKINRLEFNLSPIDSITEGFQSQNGVAVVPTTGVYHVSSNYIWGDNLLGMFYHTIEVASSHGLVDTLDIPKIKFTWDGVLHAKTPYWNYFNCEKLCDGHEIDFYPNGQKRLEGEFVNGKPSYMIEYRNDGTKQIESWYVPGSSSQTRINWFDNDGELYEYVKYEKRRHKTIKTTYTAQGQKINREVIKHGK